MKQKKFKGYDAKEVEEKWRKYWEKEKIYKFDSKKGKKVYSIDTPPPTVSGKMHIGHAFSYAQQDFVARFRRMKQGVFYPFGTDDNGLPTERLVEKLKNVKSKDMSREDFIKLCLKTLKEITPDFIEDWKKLGVSSDYDISYSTIDDNSRKISQKSFIDLYNKGEVYVADFPTIWCPECQTSIAQAELEDKEHGTLFSTLKFKSGNKDLLISTTRPELLPACVAVFVNPKDKRYKEFVGKKAKVPLFDYEVPVLEDESADIEKGTGVLMVCSYGDRFDVDAINRHKLEPKIVLEKDGTLNVKEYEGLKIKDARKKILEDLEKAGLIKEQKHISHVVNVHDKCGTGIEFLNTEQWFIKVLDKKKKFLELGKKIKWYPEYMFKRYENWVKGLEWDWSISRDRHFGIPIPVWKCDKCDEIIVADEKELPVDPLQTEKKCKKCGEKARPEEKVLDTWATSSLTPQITSFLVDGKIKIPFSLRPQAHDIIRTWAFYTIVKSHLHENKIPWEDVMVSGFVTLGGEKMSKSKGNVIDPQIVLDNYGADALRYWAASSSLGNDLDYQEQDLVAGKKFINKIFNAAKFVFMNLENYKPKKKPRKLERLDELFLEKLDKLVNSVDYRFENYEYSKAKFDVDNFFWKDFADNYLELVKFRVYNEKGDKKLSAQYTLYESLLTILKLMAPITPFVTEEIYQNYYKKFEKEKSIHLCDWPKSSGKHKDKYDDVFDKLVEIVGKIRQEKAKAQKSVKAEIKLSLEKRDFDMLKDMMDDFKAVVSAVEI
ncbi:MAG: valine--tRNA ligase, partial [Nanoarchaeota archaeon]|nr:valine--tRNA ligase [Nanoarchaeota archaeon]